MNNSLSPCPESGTGNHDYRLAKEYYHCKYCSDKQRNKPVNLVPHVHNYVPYPEKDCIFCTTCGNQRKVKD